MESPVKDDPQELVEDWIALNPSFSSRVDGKRGAHQMAATVYTEQDGIVGGERYAITENDPSISRPHLAAI